MVPIPTEADEEARRAYREKEDVSGLQEVAPTGSATSNRQAEMMYLLRRHTLGRNFFHRHVCISVTNMTGFAELEAENRAERSRPRSTPYRRNPGHWLCLDPMPAALAILWPLPRATELAVRKNAKLQSADLPWQLRESPP